MNPRTSARRAGWRAWQFADDPRCDYCLRVIPHLGAATVDHVHPRNPADGSGRGQNHPENYALCCKKCNTAKANIRLEVRGWVRRIIRYPHAPECEAAMVAEWEKRRAENLQRFAARVGTTSLLTGRNPRRGTVAQRWSSASFPPSDNLQGGV